MPCIMGILNATPDSFSDGGQYQTVEAAVQHAKQMFAEGAAIIDVGGESTRPGALRISAAEQKKRVLPIIEALAQACPESLISIDTTLADVASAAIRAGAGMINDISAGREDPAIIALAAQCDIPICLMHMQNDPLTMQDNPQYDDVVSEVCAFLHERAGVALKQGVQQECIVLDPGIGFGKTYEHNIALLAQLNRLCALGFPVLLGASRKRFIAQLSPSTTPSQRVAGSCATTVWGLTQGVGIFRVHDVSEHRQALQVAAAICAQRSDTV